MTLAPGTRLGPYEIVSALGAGGMGEVYRARDQKLGRDVALKILPDFFAGDPDRLMRFEREARTLAALNHPHIAHIHGLEESGSTRALVIELVEGTDLARRLAHESIPVEESLRMARQIVEALEAAHEKGIIHRDLKPGNIMVTPEGQVKVLDFGLAKAMDVDGDGDPNVARAANSPTITSPVGTRAGVILGTAPYMSPEQATGRPVDKRADIWAFGCVLYEMLTGTRAFHGETVQDTLAAVLRGEPDWTRLPAAVPPSVRTLLKRCLIKDRRARLADISTARYVLEDLSGATQKSEVTATPVWRRWLPWVAAGALGTAAGVVIAPRTQQPGLSTAHVIRSTLPLSSAAESGGGDIAFAPDGSSVVYLARVKGQLQLYRRSLSENASVAIAGTENGEGPFFSPDGQWLGFSDGVTLMKVPIGGGRPTAIAPLQSFAGASWGDDGFIVVGTQQETGLLRVPAAGGQLAALTVPTAEDHGNDHRYPQVLPGGRGVIFTVGTGPEDSARIVVLDSRTGVRKDLLRGSASARYVPTGHLVYARNAELFALPFDLDRLDVSGAQVRIAEGVEEQTNGAPEYSFSRAGDLAYVPGWSGGPRHTLAFVDFQGVAEKTAFPVGYIGSFRISPDGQRIAVQVGGAKNNIWVYDIRRGASTRVTFGRYHNPIWTLDGRLTMSKGPPDRLQLVRRSSDGSGTDEEITAPGALQVSGNWTADGRTLIYEFLVDRQWDVWTVSPGARKPAALVASRFNERYPRVSPDNRWLAYMSDDSGRPEIYVRMLEGDGQRWPVSVDGATIPVWAPDSRRLYYRGLGERGGLWAVDITASPTFRGSAPRLMFPALGLAPQFDITPDGKRFVVIQLDTSPRPQQIHLVLNWFATRVPKEP